MGDALFGDRSTQEVGGPVGCLSGHGGGVREDMDLGSARVRTVWLDHGRTVGDVGGELAC
jgi:hypothetical protein